MLRIIDNTGILLIPDLKKLKSEEEIQADKIEGENSQKK